MFLLDAGKIKVHVCLAGRIDQNLTWPRRDFRKHSKSSKSADPIKTTKFRHMDQYGRRAPERAKMPFQNLSLLSSFQASRLALDPEVCTCSNLNTASYHALQLDLKFWQRFQHFSKELFVMSWAQKLRKHEKRTHLDQTRTKHGPNTSFQSCAHGILASATICSMIAMQKKGPQTTWRSWHQWLCWGILQRGAQNHPKMATCCRKTTGFFNPKFLRNTCVNDRDTVWYVALIVFVARCAKIQSLFKSICLTRKRSQEFNRNQTLFLPRRTLLLGTLGNRFSARKAQLPSALDVAQPSSKDSKGLLQPPFVGDT